MKCNECGRPLKIRTIPILGDIPEMCICKKEKLEKEKQDALNRGYEIIKNIFFLIMV